MQILLQFPYSNLQYKLTVTRMGNGTRIHVSEHDYLQKTIKKNNVDTIGH